MRTREPYGYERLMRTGQSKSATEIELDVKTAAKWFANLDDDAMCKFLVAARKRAKAHPSDPENQWYCFFEAICGTANARPKRRAKMIRSWCY